MLIALLFVPAATAELLIVADEFPAMQVLAAKLKNATAERSEIVAQDRLPTDLARFRAVLVYIHGKLAAETEEACIAYTKAGGRLILLHHSISSGKRTNRHWFGFLGVDLPSGEVEQGGYKWVEPATLTLVNLATNHFITTNKVSYPEQTEFVGETKDSPTRQLPSLTLHDSEAYLNHRLTQASTVLMGFKFTDPKTGRTWMQSTAAWYRQVERGTVMYFKAGHSASDFENPAYAQILANAILCRF